MSSEHDNLEFQPPKYNTSLWAMSLADLFSIVLSIFVLLYSIASANQAKTKSAMDGVQGKFAKPSISEKREAISEPEFEEEERPKAKVINLMDALKKSLGEKGKAKKPAPRSKTKPKAKPKSKAKKKTKKRAA